MRFVLLIFVLLAIPGYSQDKAMTFRAFGMKMKSNIEEKWPEPETCNVLITITGERIKIHSSEPLTLNIISSETVKQNDVTFIKINCVDEDAFECVMWVRHLSEDDVYSLAIDYPKFSVIYLARSV